MTTPATVTDPNVDPDVSPLSPGCLFTIVMGTLGLWIAFFPRPYALAVGVGVLVPPIAFVLWRPDNQRLAETHQLPLTWQQMFCASSAFLVMGLAYRWWEEYSLLAPLPWAIASQLGATVLLLAAHLYRPSGLLTWRALCFVMYVGSSLGLANKHLDATPPRYVQGTVVEESVYAGLGHYALVAPYLDWPQQLIAAPQFDSPFKEGGPVCSAHHVGRLGFPWASHAFANCPQPNAIAPGPLQP